MKDTLVVSAFPATGKSYFFQNNKDFVILDLDSHDYSHINRNDNMRNPVFPKNYIAAIKENIGKADYILVSTHKVVRDALREAGIDYLLVYPDVKLLGEYVWRCCRRRNNCLPIKALIDNWFDWVSQCEDEAGSGVPYIKLVEGTYLSDVLMKGWPYGKQSP